MHDTTVEARVRTSGTRAPSHRRPDVGIRRPATPAARIKEASKNALNRLRHAVYAFGRGKTKSLAALEINARDVNPDPNVAMDQCLTVAVGDNAAYQCGDLRVVHPLPSTTTMGQTFTPRLVHVNHNTEHLAVDVTVSGIDVDSIEAQVFNILDTAYFSAPRRYPWHPDWVGAARRIAIPWTVWDLNGQAHSSYYVQVRVKAFISGGTTTTATDSVLFASTNRVTSPFGLLWWLEGLEELSFNVRTANQILWIGGDGSTRLYNKESDHNTWLVTSKLDRPDSITLDSGVYRRHLRSGARVEFDLSGRHRATMNSKGHRTTLWYNSTNGQLLDSIVLPIPAGGTPRVYKFKYSGSPAHLDTVFAPSVNGVARPVVLRDSIGQFNLPHVLGIKDPDTLETKFDYQSFTMRGRTDKRGVRTSFDFEGAMLAQATIHMETTADDITHTFCAAEWVGSVSCASSPVRTDSVRTWVDAPRSINDTSWFYINKWGGPDKIVNALGETTTIERTSTTFPLLATAVVQPNGFRVAASYDSRGLISIRREFDPYDEQCTNDSCNPTTRFYWNNFDKPDSIKGPGGDTTRFGYTTNGDREWQEDGRGLMSRVSFTYNPYRQLATIRPPGNSEEELFRLVYDPIFGNLQTETSPSGAVSTYHTDAVGRIDTLTTPLDGSLTRTQVTVYDLMDRVRAQRDIGPAASYSTPTGTSTAPAVTLIVNTTYDKEGNPLTIVRESDPNLANLGVPTTVYSYDGASRRKSRTNAVGFTESWTYDPAGNVTAWTTARQNHVQTTYDALNRPKFRITDSVRRAPEEGDRPASECIKTPWFPYFWGQFELSWGGTVCTRENTPDTLVIARDSAAFTYDENGRLKTANNSEARITREYYSGGAIKTEIQRVALFDGLGTYDDSRFTSHVYQMDFTYDLNGRRVTRTDVLPTCASCVQRYFYSAPSGLLDSTTDAGAGHAGARFSFAYDGAARITNRSVTGVNGTTSQVEQDFDEDGRLTTRNVIGGGQNSFLDILTYDPASRITGVSISADLPGLNETTSQAYNGLGALAVITRNRGSNVVVDEYVNDAMGNRRTARRWANGDVTTHTSQYGVEALFRVNQDATWQSGQPVPESPSLRTIDTVTTFTDHGGNVTHTFRGVWTLNTTAPPAWELATLGREWMWHAYGGDEKVRVSQRSYIDTDGGLRTIFTEYRYDALGRRVAARTRWDSACQGTQPKCLSINERTIWDGDQVLMEIRSPAASESDNASGNFLGTVRYSHAGGVDDPLAVWKTDVGGIAPHRSWRGTYEAGTGVDASSSNVTWPARSQDVFFAPDTRLEQIEPSHWIGSIIDGKKDPSGLMYMRNRYYDPKTGRFTQEDPIGLAGGMNLYGFAGGDPVNFSDPFGLCPEIPSLCIPAAAAAAKAVARAASTPTGQRVIQRGSQLARNLAQSGAVREAGEAAHHIVARAAAAAQPARDAMLRFGVEVDEAVNGVFLPAVKDYVGQAANHLTLHTQRYYQVVNDLISQAENKQQVMEALGAIRDQLLSGRFPR